MCGFAGALQPGDTAEKWQFHLSLMATSLRHRGPDDEGIWKDVRNGIGMAHRRLSILDLSSEGHQPMLSASGRYVIVYNGEIYNYLSIRNELKAQSVQWRGHSDTEVILAAIEVFGLEKAVERFNGMFAIALWDRQEQELSLLRDRLGIKPLYYACTDRGVLFGSELKALKAHPYFEPSIDRNALALLMRHNYIPAPYSIYQNAYKLKPGHILRIPMDQLKDINELHPYPYWSASVMTHSRQRNPFDGTPSEAVDQLDGLLRDAVGIRMIADVPLGAFLSGGIDSSTVVALMQAQSVRPVKTFSIGFSAEGYNEARCARRVSSHLGTEHTELYVTPDDAITVIPRLPTLYDEPFADSSQIPTFLVSQLARKHVTVSLSGDGGDELFCGYQRYEMGQNLWRKIGWMPVLGRQIISGAITSVPCKVLGNRLAWLSPLLNKYGRPGAVGDKLHKLAEILAIEKQEQLYQQLVSHWKEPESLVLDAKEPPTAFTGCHYLADLPDFARRMMYLDLITYLPDDILTKVDRASMGVGLEARVPILDHRVVEFAWQLPLSMKVKNGQKKWLLRQVLYKYVPKEYVDRPKMGFGVPINTWLRGPLREWAEALLNEKRLQEEGFFNPAPIREKWSEHLSSKRDWQYYLWDVLMFQAWLDINQ